MAEANVLAMNTVRRIFTETWSHLGLPHSPCYRQNGQESLSCFGCQVGSHPITRLIEPSSMKPRCHAQVLIAIVFLTVYPCWTFSKVFSQDSEIVARVMETGEEQLDPLRSQVIGAAAPSTQPEIYVREFAILPGSRLRKSSEVSISLPTLRSNCLHPNR